MLTKGLCWEGAAQFWGGGARGWWISIHLSGATSARRRQAPSALLHFVSPLRVTTPVRCGLCPPWLLLSKADSRVGFAQQSLDSPKPEPRGAVKARERSERPAKQVALTASTDQAPAALCPSDSPDPPPLRERGSPSRRACGPSPAKRGRAGEGVLNTTTRIEPLQLDFAAKPIQARQDARKTLCSRQRTGVTSKARAWIRLISKRPPPMARPPHKAPASRTRSPPKP